MYWLLEQSTREAIEAAIRTGAAPSVQQEAEYTARYFAQGDDSAPRLLTRAGNQAEIAVNGVLTKAPSLLAMLFGGGNTTYADINAAIAAAEQDDEIESITLRVDSPGGQFDGLFDTLAAIEAAEKPIRAIASNIAASAAYAIVSQADEVIAANHATRLGSVGVVASIPVREDVVEITSTEAPKKRPDVTTEEGKAVVREQLDAMHQIFVEAIGEGRGVSVKTVNETFGRGATLLAREAKERNMIDAIAERPLSVVGKPATTSGKTSKEEAKSMDLATLKAQHREVYDAVVQEGVQQERDRVTAHLTAGEASGGMTIAVKAIKDGTGLTASVQSEYFAASMNRSDQKRREGDEGAAAAAAATPGGGEDTATEAEQVVACVESHFGVKKEV